MPNSRRATEVIERSPSENVRLDFSVFPEKRAIQSAIIFATSRFGLIWTAFIPYWLSYEVLIFPYPISGHSRTVVGMEVLRNGDKILLILDPGVGRYQMEKTLGNKNASSSLQLLRKSIYAMKSEQFQIATVVGIVSSEAEFQVI